MNEAKDRGTTLDRNMGPEMDLVNRPNPWLPAYGFQIQHHHTNFQPTHEDLRANGSLPWSIWLSLSLSLSFSSYSSPTSKFSHHFSLSVFSLAVITNADLFLFSFFVRYAYNFIAKTLW
jgi:hypothetical protein